MSLRVKGFLIHLISSAIAALFILYWVFYIWYPAPLDQAIGVKTIFLTLVGVDLVIGPLLTLLVCKPGKSSLVFDLSVIVLLQVSALGYGVMTVAEGRPVWLVFDSDKFSLVRQIDIDARKLDQADKIYQSPSWFGPKWVAAVEPTDRESKNTLVFESAFAGIEVAQRPNLYVPLDTQFNTVVHKARQLNELGRYNSELLVKDVLNQWPEADAWLPMKGPQRSLVVLVNTRAASIVSVVDLEPWEE